MEKRNHMCDFSPLDITWGEVGDPTEKDIPKEEQDRLLSEYERELLTKKMKNSGAAAVEDSIGEELAKLDMKDKKNKAAASGKKAASPDKGRVGSTLYDTWWTNWILPPK